MIIQDIEKDTELFLIDDSFEVKEINKEFKTDYNGFFIYAPNGDYKRVYGFYGSTPYLYKSCFKVV